MEIKICHNTHFIFDLDDTLTDELDFVHSAFSHLSYQLFMYTGEDVYNDMIEMYASNKNVFEWLTIQFSSTVPGLSMKYLLKEYREHKPKIDLRQDAAVFLEKLYQMNIPCGLITDGRSITQRNKLKALKLENYFGDVIISEEFGSTKPDPANYLYFLHKYPDDDFYFFGDNTGKDFIVPLQLGWKCICLKDRGKNIHRQSFDAKPLPQFVITSFDEIRLSHPNPVVIN